MLQNVNKYIIFYSVLAFHIHCFTTSGSISKISDLSGFWSKSSTNITKNLEYKRSKSYNNQQSTGTANEQVFLQWLSFFLVGALSVLINTRVIYIVCVTSKRKARYVRLQTNLYILYSGLYLVTFLKNV